MNCKFLLFVGVFIFGFFLVVEAKKISERNTCVASTCVKNHGKSGKFTVTNKKRSGNDSAACTILFDAIKEVDKDGKIVGKTGGKDGKHSFNTFASLEFDFTDIKNVTYKGVNASMFTFTAVIPGPDANLTVDMYFFKGNGTGDVCDAEEFSIYGGTVKFNIKIENWKFCSKSNICQKGQTEEIGEYIDFTITVQKKGKAKKGEKGEDGKNKKKKAQKFTFGEGENSTKIDFPSFIKLNGDNCTQMPNEYPKMVSTGDKHSIIFRFPRFNSSVFYDPVINDWSVSSGDDSNSSSGGETTPNPTTSDGSSGGEPTTTSSGEATTASGGNLTIGESILPPDSNGTVPIRPPDVTPTVGGGVSLGSATKNLAATLMFVRMLF